MYTLQILHASDLEGGVDAIDNAPNFAAVVDALESDAASGGFASILLSAGDNYIPGPFFNAGGDSSLRGTYEGFYNALFGFIDESVLDAAADTNGDGFFDNAEIEAQIQAGAVAFSDVYTIDVNGDGFADYFEEIDTFEGRVDIAIMNALGFDASAVGNHEFDAGTDAFENIINYDSEEGNSLSTSRYADEVPGHVNFLQEVDTPGVTFPYLSANLDFSEDGDVGALFDTLIRNSAEFGLDPDTPEGLANLQSARAPLPGSKADFPAIFETAGDPPDGNDQRIAPATVITTDDGEEIGVLGATTQLLATISSTGSIDDVSNPGSNDMAALAATLQPVVDDLIDGADNTLGTADDLDKIILVSHLQQFSLEQELATLLTGVDVIIAGGSDTLLADSQDPLRAGDTADLDYPFLTTGADGAPVAVVSTDGEYAYVGRLVVTFDDNGEIDTSAIDPDVSGAFATDDAGVLAVADALGAGGVTTAEEVIAASETATDVQQLTDAVTTIVTTLDADVAGETSVFINGLRASVRTEETNLGNLTADANIAAVNAAGFPATVSIKNGGGIRAAIGELIDQGDGSAEFFPTAANPVSGKDEGEISELDIDNALRFDNGLVIVDLSTADLKIILEHAVSATEPGDTPGQFPQVGGIQFSFNPAGTAQVLDDDGNVTTAGTRVKNVALIDENGAPTQLIIEDGAVVEGASQSIQVVTLDFIAGGGDGYPFEALGTVTETGIGEQQALSDFLSDNHPTDGDPAEIGDDAFAITDTPIEQDTRIQNLSVREDTVGLGLGTGALEISTVATFQGEGVDGDPEGTSEVVAHERGKLFVTNGAQGRIDIFDIETGTAEDRIDLTMLDGFDSLQSVAVSNGPVAAAISRPNSVTMIFGQEVEQAEPGFVAVFDAETGELQATFDVGVLPDQLTFTPDGAQLLVAGEGEKNEDSENDDDPPGTVALITLDTDDLPASDVQILDFTAFDGFEDLARDAGIRIQEGVSLSNDVEPEFITVSPDGTTAFVTLQENNAIATIDLATGEITDILPLGTVDFSTDSKLDADDNGVIEIRNFDNLVGLRMPDAIESFEIDGQTFVATANEGDSRGFDEDRVGDLAEDGALDESIDITGLERLEVSTTDGDTDGDGDIDVLHTFSSRSFSIFDEAGTLVFDSGPEFEETLASIAPERFNDDDGEDDEDRSDAKGPEPEAITVGQVGDSLYAFIGLERDSGVMIYDITVPADAFFVDYIAGFDDIFGENEGDNQGPETIAFIPAEESTTGNPQIAVAYEISGSTVVYDIAEATDPGDATSFIEINEFQSNPDGGDPATQQVELLGDPNTSFDAWIISIESDAGSIGTVDRATNVTGTFDGNGIAVVEIPDLENPSFTLAVVEDFTGTAGTTDFDLDDDGVADNIGTISNPLDAIGVPDVAGDESFLYGAQLGGVDFAFTGAEPELIFRDSETGTLFAVNDNITPSADAIDAEGNAVPLESFDILPTPDTFGAVNPTTDDTGGGGDPVEAAIFEIQGAGHVSTFAGQTVITTGIVTALAFNGFYLQDATGDGDDDTSDGIFVFTDDAPTVSIGDELSIEGTVVEFIPGGAGTGNLSTTQITNPTITTLSSENALPQAVILGAAGRQQSNSVVISEDEEPVNLQNAVDDAANTFDPENDAIDFFESLEGMLVTIDDPVAISQTRTFNAFSSEAFVLADNGANATSSSENGGLNARGALEINADADGTGDLNPERIQIQFDPTISGGDPTLLTVGDQLADITGVVGYSFGNFEVNVTETVMIETPSTLTPSTTTLTVTDPDTELSIATYNILNVTANEADGDAEQIALIAQQIVDNLGSPDIIALQEVQDDSGVTDDGTLSADQTLQAIVDAIAAAGGPTYAFASAEVDEDGETGGVPGGNIRNAYLWNPDRVTAEEITTLEVEELTDLGVSDPNTFDGTRDPLLGVFTFGDEEVTLINNHFSSRFGSTPIFGGPQPFVQAGEDAREAEATAINEVVDALLAEDEDANIVVLGDLNTFEFTDEITEDLAGVGDEQVLTNLIDDLAEDDQYTFSFEGNAQVLDHILVSDALVEGAEADIVHVNVDFSFTDSNGDAIRPSDHEPIVALLTFESVEGIDLVGGFGNDTLQGTGGDDFIDGRFGRDTITAAGGDDEVIGGFGADEIDAGDGDDDVDAGFGSDVVDAGDGDDFVLGGFGRDTLLGGAGNDELIGGFGADVLDGGADDDILIGGSGRDTLFFTGDFGNDTVIGLGRRDSIVIGDEMDDVMLSLAVVDGSSIVTVTGAETFGTITINDARNFDLDDIGFDALIGGAPSTAPRPTLPACVGPGHVSSGWHCAAYRRSWTACLRSLACPD
ncbi:MAG: choice-of-anchor I family protein [Pseudomonadota bacterium]